MKLFFDTSALVKFFYEEEGSPKVTELISLHGNEIWISEKDWFFVAADENLCKVVWLLEHNAINPLDA